jgi:hypothetical protein
VRRARAALTATTRSTPFVKEVTRSLADAGFLRAVAIKGEYGSYEVFQATPRGVAVADAAFEVFASDLTDRVETSDGATSDVVEKNADSKKAEFSEVSRREAALKALAARLPNLNARVILPVPESLARAEAERKASAAAKVRELEDAGADTTNIPAAELEAGSGPALNAELQWSRAIAKLRAWRRRQTRARRRHVRAFAPRGELARRDRREAGHGPRLGVRLVRREARGVHVRVRM